MKILVSDKLAEEGLQILKAQEGFEVDYSPGLSPEELKAKIKDCDALIIRSGTKVTADVIEAAEKLRVIGRAGVGLDNVDLTAATKKGIVAMNTPAGNTTSTAEHTFSLILALSRNIPQACAAMKAGRWDRSQFSGVELHGKTLGIIGLGRIGSTVARMGQAFGMRVLAYDPYLSEEVATKKGVELADFERLIRESDYITIHIPKSSETKNLISDKEFDAMKSTARLINCARGGIVDESALVRALEGKKIAGCALDVYEVEPLPEDSPLREWDNCITTPHLGASTSEAQVNVAIEIAQNVRNALLGEGILNAANFPSLNAETLKALQPYIDLGERMGRFSGQLIDGAIQEINLTYSGHMTKYKVAPVSMALVYGVLHPILGETVNWINALEVARERGIQVEEIQSTKEEEFVNLVALDAKTDKETFTLWGTLTSNQKPRIVKVNDVYVEAVPEGYMLIVHNLDRPGIVGTIGTILAESGINIAGISLGREKSGGRAVSVLNVDSEIPPDVLKKIQDQENILFAKLISV